MSDDERADELEWTLGFVEPVQDKSKLLRHKFPSKIGGRPAWLDPVNLPSKDDLLTSTSKEPLSFLLQIYCPVDGKSEAFHRTIFLFTTTKGGDLHKQGSVRAFRSQLPRENEFYASTPSSEKWPPQPKECEAKKAQNDPWRVLDTEAHLASSGQTSASLPAVSRHSFPEFQLATDFEEEPAELPQRTANGVSQDPEDEIRDSDVTPDVEAEFSAVTTEEQKHFADFAARISWEPDQVVRYCFQEGASPLWPYTRPIPRPEDIPQCPHCSGPRQFEFEVLPQLLNHLDIEVDSAKDESLDWGAIAVYSCANSCSTSQAYCEEFVYVQPTLWT